MGTRADSTPRSTIGAEFYSLLDAVDSESMVDGCRVERSSERFDTLPNRYGTVSSASN